MTTEEGEEVQPEPITVQTSEPKPAPVDSIPLQTTAKERAITALFAARGAPLAAYAGEMVAAADAAGIDWRLIPAIAILESGGGVQACGNNAYGYASCAVDFASPGEAIAVVAATLAGYGVDAGTAMCIWVGGSPCTTAAELEYRSKGEGLFAQLTSAQQD